ncbi:MAG: type I 3-dehydroquinase-domain-containing protein [Monoraphidium minutum]|nr:MAG: type I 3-dehydroquinase-domain-containing protein [Monoraphidium minutum]
MQHRARATSAPQATPEALQAGWQPNEPTYICTSVTADTVAGALAEIGEAAAAGADVIELRLDFLKEFDPSSDLKALMDACKVPYIVTYRPTWEGGHYSGPEPERLATLKFAAMMGAPYVDVEFKAAHLFFADTLGEVPVSTRVILSSHDFEKTPPRAELHARVAAMREMGADIVKIAAMANDISDAATMLSLLTEKTGPTISLSMGERGQITRLLAAKYGGHLTFASLSAERASAPGQPTIQQLQGLYRFRKQGPATKLFGIVGNPVHHSKSPLIHNSAFEHIGFDGVYVPLLVDDMPSFMAAFEGHDFAGFSVTIPHKHAALEAATEADPVAAQIGAVNTLVKIAPDHGSDRAGGWRGFNTDWHAAIGAVERGLSGGQQRGSSTSGGEGDSPLKGRTFVVVGAGGAGRALAFGAAARGARVLVANRSVERGAALAAAVPGGAGVVSWEALQAGEVEGDVLGNSTSVGMVPNVEDTPVPAAALSKFKLVFDAVYTPRDTRLLRDAAAAGCATVDGVEMFVGQAVEQFALFTGAEAPVAVMEAALLGKAP